MKERLKYSLQTAYFIFCRCQRPFLVLCLGMLFYSCNKSASHKNNISVGPVAHSEDFKVNISISGKESDVIDFFYVQDSLNERFTEQKKLRSKIEGNNQKEQIEFVVKDGKVLKFRLDLGRNMAQEGVSIGMIEVRTRGKNICIPGHLLQYFFDENKFMSFSKNSYVSFSPVPRKVPFMTSSALLNKRMKIEF